MKELDEYAIRVMLFLDQVRKKKKKKKKEKEEKKNVRKQR